MSRRKDKRSVCPAVEQLEPRWLFDVGSVVIGDGPGAVAKSLVYYDGDDGTQVTVQMKGGLATVNWGDPATSWDVVNGVVAVGSPDMPAYIDIIELAETTQRSQLAFKTKIPKGSEADKLVVINGIVGATEDTPLGKLNAPGLLIGGFDDAGEMVAIRIQGGVGAVAIRGCGSGLLDLGGTAADKLSFMASSSIEASSLTFGGTITKLVAGAWESGGTITAGAFGKIRVTGFVADDDWYSGLLADVEALSGSIGSIHITGGNLGGSVAAPNGAIGSIKLSGKTSWIGEDGQKTWSPREAELLADLTAGDTNGLSIGRITVAGGVIGGEQDDGQPDPVVIRASGDVGPIKCWGTSARILLPELGWCTLYSGSAIVIDLQAGGSVGKMSAVGGGVYGVIAAGGEVAGVSAKAVRVYDYESSQWTYTGGTVSALIEASRIRTVAATGGDLSAILTAPVIDRVSCKAIGRNAKLLHWTQDGYDEYEQVEGEVFGGNISVRLTMLGEGARLGSVTAFGGSLTAEGEVSFAPETAKLVSKPMRYITGFEDEGDEDHYRWVAVYETVGGDDAVTNNLEQV